MLTGIMKDYHSFTRIYSAGKVWHAPKFREMRDKHGYNVIANWIEWDERATGDVRIWQHCMRDAANCDLVILYCEGFDEEQRGAIMECGHAIGNGKPVYCINKCKSLTANKISDVAFTQWHKWHWTTAKTIEGGYKEAVMHYIQNYSVPLVGDLHYTNTAAVAA